MFKTLKGWVPGMQASSRTHQDDAKADVVPLNPQPKTETQEFSMEGWEHIERPQLPLGHRQVKDTTEEKKPQTPIQLDEATGLSRSVVALRDLSADNQKIERQAKAAKPMALDESMISLKDATGLSRSIVEESDLAKTAQPQKMPNLMIPPAENPLLKTIRPVIPETKKPVTPQLSTVAQRRGFLEPNQPTMRRRRVRGGNRRERKISLVRHLSPRQRKRVTGLFNDPTTRVTPMQANALRQVFERNQEGCFSGFPALISLGVDALMRWAEEGTPENVEAFSPTSNGSNSEDCELD